jgi:hypothetical protein
MSYFQPGLLGLESEEIVRLKSAKGGHGVRGQQPGLFATRPHQKGSGCGRHPLDDSRSRKLCPTRFRGVTPMQLHGLYPSDGQRRDLRENMPTGFQFVRLQLLLRRSDYLLLKLYA